MIKIKNLDAVVDWTLESGKEKFTSAHFVSNILLIYYYNMVHVIASKARTNFYILMSFCQN